jgi:TRAP-type C4-dicarboxylate transport system permease small subunit
MRNVARALVFVDDLVLKITLFLCACLLLTMVGIAGLGVIFRFVLHDSLSWSDELGAYLFVWLTCLGAAAGSKLRVHPTVTLLAMHVPRPFAQLLADFADCAIIALGAVFVAYGGDMISLMGTETASSMPISMVYPYLSIPVCGALLVFHSVMRIAVSHLAPDTQRSQSLAHGVSEHI